MNEKYAFVREVPNALNILLPHAVDRNWLTVWGLEMRNMVTQLYIRKAEGKVKFIHYFE